MKRPDEKLLLGVDLGTTTVSFRVVSPFDGSSVAGTTVEHFALYKDGYAGDEFACDPFKLTSAALDGVKKLTGEYPGICSIGVTGQMHGIVCLDKNGGPVSPLYTWQNGFGSRTVSKGRTFCDVIGERCGVFIPSGYGAITYLYLKETGKLDKNTAKISTLPDYFVSLLTGKEAVSHPTNAASLGAFDIEKNDFDPELLKKLGVERSVLPAVAKDHSLQGVYGGDIKVACAIGDNQAGAFGLLPDENTALLNIGTSGQISVITSSHDAPGGETRPFFDGRYLLSGATLCGGKAFEALKDLAKEILVSFGCGASDSEIYAYLREQAEKYPSPGIFCDTRFCGSRSDPSVRGAIENIGINDLAPGRLSSAFLDGIANELYGLYRKMPHQNVSRIVASGNALRKNEALRKRCEKIFRKELLIPRFEEEAAFGAALYGGGSAGVISQESARNTVKNMYE